MVAWVIELAYIWAGKSNRFRCGGTGEPESSDNGGEERVDLHGALIEMGFQRLSRDRRFVSDDVNDKDQRLGHNAFCWARFSDVTRRRRGVKIARSLEHKTGKECRWSDGSSWVESGPAVRIGWLGQQAAKIYSL